MCPIKTAKVTCINSKSFKLKSIATVTTKVALRTSPNNVNIAASLLPVLMTFVAPGFFDPMVLGSESFKDLLIIIPNESDPIK